MTTDADTPGSGTGTGTGTGTRRRNSVAPNPWRRGRRRPATNDLPCESRPDAASPSPRMVASLFADATGAERAYQALFARGYRHDEVIVAMPEAVWHALFSGDPANEHPNGVPASAASVSPAAPATAAPTQAQLPRQGGAFPAPIAIPVSSRNVATRIMAAGRAATTLMDAIRRDGDDCLADALFAVGIPERMTRGCAAGIREGKIMLGVMPRSGGDAFAIADEWVRQKGESVGR